MRRSYAAAGSPYKKRKYSTKKSVVPLKAKVFRSVDLYSPQLAHHFKRDLQDCLLYTSAALTLKAVDSTGAAPVWLSTGSLTADQGGVAATAQFGMSIVVTLSAVQTYMEFTNLFERYAIEKMTLRIQTVMGDSYNTVASQLPYIYYVEDKTDAVVPASQVAIQQYPGVKDQTLSQEHPITMTIHPVPANIAYAGGAAVGYTTPNNNGPVWCDSAFPTTQHYGAKFWVRNWIGAAANQGNAIRIQPTLYFKVKEAH